MGIHFKRKLRPPKKSFFLFGPRGTGKSTWLKEQIEADLWIDLLSTSHFLKLASNPGEIRALTDHLKAGSWVIIDEVQRVPELLNEVHWLYENKKIHFALSGSSARKLKRGGANLLAGRALQRNFFPLVFSEYGERLRVEEWVEWGALPLVVSDSEYRQDTLSSYVDTYLRQELMEEGLIRKLEPFARFLQVAGIMNGQVLNRENVARECHVGRTTVDQYFNILEDTLLGFKLEPYRPGIRLKEASHPKFYFFDSGVARACAGLIHDSVDSVWKGFAFETALLNEVRAYNHYAERERSLFYYRTASGVEIDLLVEMKRKTMSQTPEVIAIEMKYSKKWDRRWCEPSETLTDEKKIKVLGRYGVYLGNEVLTYNGMTVLPVRVFLEKLHSGKIF